MESYVEEASLRCDDEISAQNSLESEDLMSCKLQYEDTYIQLLLEEKLKQKLQEILNDLRGDIPKRPLTRSGSEMNMLVPLNKTELRSFAYYIGLEVIQQSIISSNTLEFFRSLRPNTSEENEVCQLLRRGIPKRNRLRFFEQSDGTKIRLSDQPKHTIRRHVFEVRSNGVRSRRRSNCILCSRLTNTSCSICQVPLCLTVYGDHSLSCNDRFHQIVTLSTTPSPVASKSSIDKLALKKRLRDDKGKNDKILANRSISQSEISTKKRITSAIKIDRPVKGIDPDPRNLL